MNERVVIIDYGSGNLHSARKAFERAAQESGANATISLSACADDVAAADRVVLPGVGAYADCRRGLDAVPGLLAALEDTVRRRGRPFLGICVGMQLMATRGLEFGETKGLDWIAGDVVAIEPSDPALKIPHMGWNEVAPQTSGGAHPVLAGMTPDAHMYFVHSYHLRPRDPRCVLASTDYGGPVAAVVFDRNASAVYNLPAL